MAIENVIILMSRIFFRNFDLMNWVKNEFENNNEKLCSWSTKRFFRKIDFKAVGTHESHSTARELRFIPLLLPIPVTSAVYCLSMSANFPLDGVPLKFPETGRPNKLKPSDCPDSSSIDPRLLKIILNIFFI